MRRARDDGGGGGGGGGGGADDDGQWQGMACGQLGLRLEVDELDGSQATIESVSRLRVETRLAARRQLPVRRAMQADIPSRDGTRSSRVRGCVRRVRCGI